MKKMIVLATFLGLAVMFAAPAKSEAFCLIFCSDSDEVAVVEVEAFAEVTDSSLTAGDGNTTALKNSNTVVIGGDVNTNQRNFIGGIGVNHGDISQSNSANITGQQNTNIHDNDMRSFRGRTGNN